VEAKVAFYLKASLGSSSELLSLFTATLSRSPGKDGLKKRRFVSLRSRPVRSAQSIEIKIPVAGLARELEALLPQAQAHPDLPRGRRRAGWQNETSRAFENAAGRTSDVSVQELRGTSKEYRSGRRVRPELTSGANSALKTA
jgi:hypothetical protein